MRFAGGDGLWRRQKGERGGDKEEVGFDHARNKYGGTGWGTEGISRRGGESGDFKIYICREEGGTVR